MMKRSSIKKNAVGIIILLYSFSSPLFADVPIPILPEGTSTSDVGEIIYRTPALVPLACVLEDDACLAITWFADLGTVSVEIENQSTGEYYQNEVCACEGTDNFLISGSAGAWRLTVTLSNDECFIGEFQIGN